MRSPIFVFKALSLLSLCVPCALLATQPDISDISKTWSGIDKTTQVSYTYRIELTLEEAPEEIPVADLYAIDLFSTMFGKAISPTARSNMKLLSDAIHGLNRAMWERPCDDPVIQRLDKNLIILFNRKHSL
jgi:hypothetical protein